MTEQCRAFKNAKCMDDPKQRSHHNQAHINTCEHSNICHQIWSLIRWSMRKGNAIYLSFQPIPVRFIHTVAHWCLVYDCMHYFSLCLQKGHWKDERKNGRKREERPSFPRVSRNIPSCRQYYFIILCACYSKSLFSVNFVIRIVTWNRSYCNWYYGIR